jgi:hypothetical protein
MRSLFVSTSARPTRASSGSVKHAERQLSSRVTASQVVAHNCESIEGDVRKMGIAGTITYRPAAILFSIPNKKARLRAN